MAKLPPVKVLIPDTWVRTARQSQFYSVFEAPVTKQADLGASRRAGLQKAIQVAREAADLPAFHADVDDMATVLQAVVEIAVIYTPSLEADAYLALAAGVAEAMGEVLRMGRPAWEPMRVALDRFLDATEKVWERAAEEGGAYDWPDQPDRADTVLGLEID